MLVLKVVPLTSDIDLLIRNFKLAVTPEEAIAACSDIASLLLNTYRVSHENLKCNQILQGGLIVNLKRLVDIGLEEVMIQLERSPNTVHNLENLAKISQACSMVAEYYSVNDQVENYKIWMKKTEEFIHEVGLTTHLSYAALLETKASEISRRLTQKNPHGTIEECIALFNKALEIYAINGITLDGADSSARHTQNSLCVAISKLILSMVEKGDTITPELMEQVKVESVKALKLLETIEVQFLKPGVDASKLHASYYADLDIKEHVNEPKRMSNMLSTKALIETCNNEINDGVMMTLAKALECMPKEAIPQYSNTLNRNANFLLAYAALIYNNANNKNQDHAAQASLALIAEHDYVKLANKFFVYDLSQDPELVSRKSYAAQDISRADQLMAEAVQLYVDSYSITRGNAGETYGKVAEKFLLKIAEHPACKNNSSAMGIIANALQGSLHTNQSGISLTPGFANAKMQAAVTDVSELQVASRPSPKQ